MLCVRCGMDSTTTDVCEWCKRPFLPPGAKVTGQRPGKGGKPPAPAAGVTPETAATPPPAAGAMLAGAAPPAEEEEAAAAPAAPAAEAVLRPLGAGAPRSSSSAEAQPFPGTGEAGADGSVDVSQYMGSGQSIFQPMEKPRTASGQLSPQERFVASRRAALARGQGVEVPENTRLMRAAIAGAIVAMTATLAQFFMTKQVPLKMLVVPIERNDQFSGALLYGVTAAVLLGFMLAAMLVKFRMGAFVGLIAGLVIGWAGLSNFPWGLIAGGVAGLVVGIFAAKGARRVVNV